jgi:NAD(P)-dependent dehydrogenase (short-subunit alcohol dehydrogenase family)
MMSGRRLRTISALVAGFPTHRGAVTVALTSPIGPTAGAVGANGIQQLQRRTTVTTNRRPSPHAEEGHSTGIGRDGIAMFSSSFAGPEPPLSRGLHVFADIDFSVSEGPSSPSSLRRSDPDAVFVVNGASRGIGLQFVKTLLDGTCGRVVACCRSPGTAAGLQELMEFSAKEKGRDRLFLVPIDLEDQTSVERAGAEIRRRFDRVDLLLNVAGILGDGTSTPGPERSISKVDRDWMEKTFQVNVFGPVMFSKELIPLLSQGRRRPPTKKPAVDGGDFSEENPPPAKSRPNSVIANLSARVGSISDNGLGGWYSYRMSKAALNQATRTLANELKRQSVWCVALHPGTTDTDLSRPFQKNVSDGRLFPAEFTVQCLMKVVDSMQDANSGGLYDWAGKAIPF